MNETTIKEAQRLVDEWIRTIGGKYFSELTNMVLLTEETGELARVIARVYGDQIAKEGDLRKSLAEEMADVLWVLICLANQTGVDLTEAFMQSLEKKRQRDRKRFAGIRH
ncbi:MAG: nucleotide pyrophosphohydrolase [Muribaculaceae bacterium]|nr:nucleotide pyrophosphohydrolase [Muribaculaceae bacterium]